MSLRPIILFVSVLLTASLSARARSPQTLSRDALTGIWTATVAPDDASKSGSKEFTDTITIKGGKFASEALKKDGFEPAVYEDKPSPIGAIAQFSVTLTNTNGDTAKWTGTGTGKEMTGELTITKKNGDSVTYTFKASKP